MKKLRIAALLLAAIMLLGIFAGCSTGTGGSSTTGGPAATDNGESGETGDESEAAWPYIGEYELEYWTPTESKVLTYMTDFNEKEVWKYIEEKTGVHIKWVHIANENAPELYSLLISSRDLPDIISHSINLSYIGGPDVAVENGDYLRLNELIDSNAPNYKAVLKSNEIYEKEATTDAGNIWAFYLIYDMNKYRNAGLMYRRDIAKNIGWNEAPKTIVEWEDFAQDCIAAGYSHPIGICTGGYNNFMDNLWVSAWNSSFTFFNMDGVATFGPTTDGYRGYLKTMNEWYNKGYLVENVESYTWGDMLTLYYSDKLVASYGADGIVGDGPYTSGAASNPEFYLAAAPYPTLDENSVSHLAFGLSYLANPTVITGECEHPEIAAQWLDYLYSDEGIIAMNYGVEGITYTIEDGEYVLTDLVSNNPELNLIDSLRIYTGMGVPTVELAEVQYNFDVAKRDEGYVWNQADGSWTMPTGLTLTADENTRYSTIMGDINTYVQECTAKFILGTMNVDTEWDTYVDTIKSSNIDEATAIEQAALDRYLAR